MKPKRSRTPRCATCGGRHDPATHDAVLRAAAERRRLEEQKESLRRGAVKRSRAAGDRLRAQEPAVGRNPDGLRTRARCEACNNPQKYGDLRWCEKCALLRGYERCGTCGRLVRRSSPTASPTSCSYCVARPKCRDCGVRLTWGGTQWCQACSLRHGYARCVACGQLTPREKGSPARTRCSDCHQSNALHSSSVHTVSGGLPGMGRRH